MSSAEFGPVLTIASSHALYPEALRDLAKPPPCLQLVGMLPVQQTKCVAIVGTRRSEPQAEDFTRRLACDLARQGHVIVSGGALGIDTAAHWGALEGGGPTIAVLATGVSRAYPVQNRSLFDEIVQRGGALLSERESDDPAWRGVFLARNRIIAALAQITVVIQAPYESGAMSTAAYARQLGRTLLAVPYPPWDIRGHGCLQLLADGAGIPQKQRGCLNHSGSEGGSALPSKSQETKESRGTSRA